MAEQVTVYTKTLEAESLDGSKQTFTGTAALAFQKKLEDNQNFTKTVDPTTGVQTFYNMNPNACGICKTATVTPGTKQVDAAECEDGLPNCPVTAITVSPTTASVAVGATTTLKATTTPVGQPVSWSSSAPATATVSNGVVTGVKAGSATITVSDAATGEVTATATITVTAA